MNRLTKSQSELLDSIASILPANTHQIARALGFRQAYESYLRDRLFRIADRGALAYAEKGGGVHGCRERIWSLPVA